MIDPNRPANDPIIEMRTVSFIVCRTIPEGRKVIQCSVSAIALDERVVHYKELILSAP